MWESRVQVPLPIPKMVCVMKEIIETSVYDKCKIITNCTVEIWTNSITGEQSIGWYKTDESEEIEDE